jgi:DNA-binding MarR family transcriptional regulator
MTIASAHIAALVAMIAQDAGQKALTPQHLLLLAYIVAADTPVTVTDTADRMGLSYAQTSRLVHRLIDDGYVERKQDRHDARLNWFTATTKGRNLDQSVRGCVAAASPATRVRPSTEDTRAS